MPAVSLWWLVEGAGWIFSSFAQSRTKCFGLAGRIFYTIKIYIHWSGCVCACRISSFAFHSCINLHLPINRFFSMFSWLWQVQNKVYQKSFCKSHLTFWNLLIILKVKSETSQFRLKVGRKLVLNVSKHCIQFCLILISSVRVVGYENP